MNTAGRIEAAGNLEVFTPDALRTVADPTNGRDVRGLARNLSAELAPKNDATPACRGALEILETTVLFPRTPAAPPIVP